MSEWIIKRRFSSYEVEADTRSKARYKAYKAYCRKAKRPVTFKEFFMTINKIKRIV